MHSAVGYKQKSTVNDTKFTDEVADCYGSALFTIITRNNARQEKRREENRIEEKKLSTITTTAPSTTASTTATTISPCHHRLS
jgi:hypothetical protein